MATLTDGNYRLLKNGPYMSPNHLNYFRKKILEMQATVQRKLRETLEELREHKVRETEILDRSDANTFRDMKLMACQRYRMMIEQYDAALKRIDEGSFGYCQITGDEIGLERLESIPYANLSVEAQELLERRSRRSRVA